MAAFSRCSVSLVADNEDAGGDFYDVVGDGVEFVDGENALDLGKEAFEETKVAAGDAFDDGDGLSIGEVIGIECATEMFPLTVEDEEELFSGEGSVVVGEAESAVELWVLTKLLVDARHPNQDDRGPGSVVMVAEDLDRVGGEAFRLVDDDQFDGVGGLSGAGHLAGVGSKLGVFADVGVDVAAE